MVRMGAVALGFAMASCASERRAREPAGTGPSLLPPDRSIQQVFKSDDEAAKAACTWLWRNEPKAKRFEYCGFIVRDSEGIKATLPETTRREGQCNRPDDPPGVTVDGWYHSHRWTSDFSWWDKQHGLAIGLYLCAPGELVKKLTSEGTVIVK